MNYSFVEACQTGDLPTVEKWFRTPLYPLNHHSLSRGFMYACSNGHTEIVRLLLKESRIDINKENSDGETGFMLACENGHPEIVSLLLGDSRIDVHKTAECVRVPLSSALQRGHHETVALLLMDARIDTKGLLSEAQISTELMEGFLGACEKGHTEIVRLLLKDSRIDANNSNPHRWTGFMLACSNGHTEIVRLLLEEDSRVDVNKGNIFGETGFMYACSNGHGEIVASLLENNHVDVTKTDESGRFTSMSTATFSSLGSHSHLSNTVPSLLLNSERFDTHDRFIYACMGGCVHTVSILLQNAKLDVNYRHHVTGRTGISLAYRCGRADVVSMLLNDNRVDLSNIAPGRASLFHEACAKKDTQMMLYIIRNKRVSLTQADDEGITPYMCAYLSGYLYLALHMIHTSPTVHFIGWRKRVEYLCSYLTSSSHSMYISRLPQLNRLRSIWEGLLGCTTKEIVPRKKTRRLRMQHTRTDRSRKFWEEELGEERWREACDVIRQSDVIHTLYLFFFCYSADTLSEAKREKKQLYTKLYWIDRHPNQFLSPYQSDSPSESEYSSDDMNF